MRTQRRVFEKLSETTKVELASERISGRQLIIQTPINPFLSDCDYLNDLKVQDTHLRPRDSNI